MALPHEEAGGSDYKQGEKKFGDYGYIPCPDCDDGSQVGAHVSQKLSKLYTVRIVYYMSVMPQ